MADTRFFLTDGKPTVPMRLRETVDTRYMKPETLIDCVSFWSRRCRVVINTIGIGDGKGDFLERLAGQNDGAYTSP